jgi:hypothetical protein
MPTREELQALRAGAPLPAHQIMPLRTKGMHSIRFEFVVRVLRTGLKTDTLSIYWERANEFLLVRSVETVNRRLVLGRMKPVIGEFPDLWLLCYPDDEEIKQGNRADDTESAGSGGPVTSTGPVESAPSRSAKASRFSAGHR